MPGFVFCKVIPDGEAESLFKKESWHSIKMLRIWFCRSEFASAFAEVREMWINDLLYTIPEEAVVRVCGRIVTILPP